MFYALIMNENQVLVYYYIQLAVNQAVSCCPAIGGLWGALLVEMKSTAYGDFGAKTQFAP